MLNGELIQQSKVRLRAHKVVFPLTQIQEDTNHHLSFYPLHFVRRHGFRTSLPVLWIAFPVMVKRRGSQGAAKRPSLTGFQMRRLSCSQGNILPRPSTTNFSQEMLRGPSDTAWFIQVILWFASYQILFSLVALCSVFSVSSFLFPFRARSSSKLGHRGRLLIPTTGSC